MGGPTCVRKKSTPGLFLNRHPVWYCKFEVNIILDKLIIKSKTHYIPSNLDELKRLSFLRLECKVADNMAL